MNRITVSCLLLTLLGSGVFYAEGTEKSIPKEDAVDVPAISAVSALGGEPVTANPGDPAWDAAEREPAAAHLARPSANQYAWHEQERTFFVCIGVATWEGTEYDADGKTNLAVINPEKFDADAIWKHFSALP